MLTCHSNMRYDQVVKYTEPELHLTLSEEEVYALVFGYMPDFKTKVCSPLRPDRHPGCYFQEWNGRIWFKDFADDPPVMSCYDMLRRKLGLPDNRAAYREARRHCHLVVPSRVPKAKPSGDSCQIRFNRRRWLPCDQAYWEPFGITREQLQAAGVQPVLEFQMKSHAKCIEKQVKELCYAYTGFEGMRVKLYFPLRKGRYRFLSTCKADDVGYVPGDGAMERVIISKSYKDAQVLANAGYHALWLQNEGMMPKMETFHRLLDDAGEVVIFMDNDAAGRKAADKLRQRLAEWHPMVVELPAAMGKDPAECRARFGEQQLLHVLHNLMGGE